MASNLKSDGLQPKSDGLQPKSDGLQPKSDGLEPNSGYIVAVAKQSPYYALNIFVCCPGPSS